MRGFGVVLRVGGLEEIIDMQTKHLIRQRLWITTALSAIAWAARVHATSLVPPSLGAYPPTTVASSGNAMVLPNAAPAGATAVSVSTSTDFKGRLDVDPVSGAVRITDAHPASGLQSGGAYTVTIRAASPAGSTQTTFALTVTTPEACQPVSFATATNFDVGSNPLSVAVGDFNGDGKQDLATANYSVNNITIRLGNGSGGFPSSTTIAVGFTPWTVVVGDFNGDGKQDLAVTNNSTKSNSVSILLGDGSGGFGTPTNFGAGSQPIAVAVGDFNGDGIQDLAVTNTHSNDISILLGNGSGGFGQATNLAVGTIPDAVVVGDFNGDGKQDLAVANRGSSDVSILLGEGSGGFGMVTNFAVRSLPYSVVVGDFNGDGKQDLAVANAASANVSILLGDGMGFFGPATNFSVGFGSGPESIALGDFNGDGKQDLAVANTNAHNVAILLGDGSGAFEVTNNFAVGQSPGSVAVGDFNGDGQQDLALANFDSNNVSILRCDCGSPTQAQNISTRLRVETDSNVLIGGFIITGSGSKKVAIRGVGPSLTGFGISDALADPTLELRQSSTLILGNDDWQDNASQAAQLSSAGLALQNPKESGLVANLSPDAYTAILAGKDRSIGVGLLEIYDISQTIDSQLANISTRGLVGTTANVMIGGFILGGGGNTRVAVRGIGPSLAQFGLSPVLANPTLELHDGNGALLISNDNWQDDPVSAAQLTGAGLAPQDSNESGIFVTLPPGAFTAILAGKNNGTGIGLVEVYNLR